MEEERDELRDKLQAMTDERDDLQREKEELEVKVNDAKDALRDALSDLEGR